MKTFVTSDHHFGHVNIIDFCDRPWRKDYYPYAPDVEAMNEALITFWNETVAPGDTVMHLGDLALGPKSTIGEVVPKLHGTIILLAGNHDRCWKGRKGAVKAENLYYSAGISEIRHGSFLQDGYLWCHFPYTVDFRRQGIDKFSSDRPRREYHPKTKLIHGHVHNTWPNPINDDQYNVSIDVHNYRPVDFEQIREEFPA